MEAQYKKEHESVLIEFEPVKEGVMNTYQDYGNVRVHYHQGTTDPRAIEFLLVLDSMSGSPLTRALVELRLRTPDSETYQLLREMLERILTEEWSAEG